MVLYGTVSPDHANIRVTIDGRNVSIPGGSGGAVSALRPQVSLLTVRDDLMLIMFLSDKVLLVSDVAGSYIERGS